MAVTAQAGIFSFGGQVAKDAVATEFYQHRGSNIDLSTISDDRLGPPEVGGTPTPTIPFRAGVLASGGAVINPRLEDTLGWLLFGAMGAVTTSDDEDVEANVVVGMYSHEFGFAADEASIPYMSFRKHIPGNASDGSDSLGEVFQDCKIINTALALVNDGLISTRLDVLGRATDTQFEYDPTWTYVNTEFEDYQSIPIGSVLNGYMKIPGFSGTELPIVAGNIAMTNAPLDIRQERVFGSPYLEEITVVGRALTVDLLIKWKDPALFSSILTGNATGTQWTQTPFVQDLDILALASGNQPNSAPATPWGLRVEAPTVMYQVVGGIQLAGNQSVAIRVTGTALANAGSYATIKIGNETTEYVWPT